MSLPNRGRFTARGADRVESQVASLVEEVGGVVDRTVSGEQLAALVLLGGDGRGEGGVEIREGREFPHNNLDFLLLTRGLGGAQRQRLQNELDRSLSGLIERCGIGLDVSLFPESKLRRAPCQVMWYDMRFGHKTIRGDEGLVPGLTGFTRHQVPAFDVLNLLVNRSTLLVINRFLVKHARPGPNLRRTLIKHAIKAIIGVGDALLYSAGQYHWSYQEKQRRMRRCVGAPEELRKLYDQAMEFRFLPDYSSFDGVDMESWSEQLWKVFSRVHLGFEEHRMGRQLGSWEGYLQLAGGFHLSQILSSPRSLVRAVYRGWMNPAPPPGLSWKAQLGFRVSSPREKLSLVFPLLAYGVGSEQERRACAALLGSEDSTTEALQEAYLKIWADVGDGNFNLVLQRFGVDLREEDAS